MINSTVSSESAPRSFVKLASLVTSAGSTPSLSTIIDTILSLISEITLMFLVKQGAKVRDKMKKKQQKT